MKQLAIMKGVDLGMRDCDVPVMWFSTYIREYVAALQVLSWDDAKKLVIDSGVHSVKELEGKACWVENDESKRTITFLEYAKIGG